MSFTKLCSLALVISALSVFVVIANDEVQSPVRDLVGFENINDSQPLWEFGVGVAAVEVAHYPASSERNFLTLAAPYVIYRGDIFRVGGNSGLRAVIVETSDFELDFSFGGAFSANSEENTARAGMPELDFLFEVGPQLVYRVSDHEFEQGGNAKLRARLQARAVFSTDFKGLDQRGFVLEPRFSYQQRGVFFKETGLNVALTFTFASEKSQDYFYQVDPDFVTSNRIQYDAKAGYLGAELSIGFSFPVVKNIRGFVNTSTQFHQGAANQDSPLYEKDITYSIGIGFVWRLYKSDTKASW